MTQQHRNNLRDRLAADPYAQQKHEIPVLNINSRDVKTVTITMTRYTRKERCQEGWEEQDICNLGKGRTSAGSLTLTPGTRPQAPGAYIMSATSSPRPS
jgi:hypothetical protein